MGSFADRFKRVVKDNNLTPEQEAKYQSFKKRGYRVPSKRLIKSASDIEGIRASGVINTGVLDYVAERIKAGVSTAEIGLNRIFLFPNSSVSSNFRFSIIIPRMTYM